jgi:hypothetical protein
LHFRFIAASLQVFERWQLRQVWKYGVHGSQSRSEAAGSFL